jgi:hypothetical protein
LSTRVEYGVHTDVDLDAIMDGSDPMDVIKSMEQAHVRLLSYKANRNDMVLDEDTIKHTVWPFVRIYEERVKVNGQWMPKVSVVSCRDDQEPEGYRLETSAWADSE